MNALILHSSGAFFALNLCCAPVQAVDTLNRSVTAWSVTGSDCSSLRLELHTRTDQESEAPGSERLRIRAGTGTYVHAKRPIEPARAIPELLTSIRMRADRSGLQLMARVVLPRSVNKTDNQPVSFLIRGDFYQRVGTWQRLELKNPNELIQAAVPGLRADFGSWVDPREAYVDQLVVNIYGGPGVTNIWLDDIRIEGHVESRHRVKVRTSPANLASVTRSRAPVSSPTTTGVRSPQRRGTALSFNGRPFFARAVEHQGESLSFLSRLGFNVVLMARAPSEHEARQAAELGMWIVPTFVDESQLNNLSAEESKSILGWELGRHLSRPQLDAVREKSDAIRQDSEHFDKLLIGRPTNGLKEYSRCLDVLVHERTVLGTTFEMADFDQWCRDRSRLAQDGAPFWVSVQTEANDLHPPGQTSRNEAPLYVDPQQVTQLAYLAIAAGARGLVFRSSVSLDGSSPQSRLRATALRTVNHRLSRVDSWLARGDISTPAEADVNFVIASVLMMDRSRLVIPIYTPPGSQTVLPESPSARIALTLPGISESDDAYILTATGLRSVQHQRVAGGVQLNLDASDTDSLILLTQNPKLTRALARRVDAAGNELVRLKQELAALYMESIIETERQLTPTAPRLAESIPILRKADSSLAQCRKSLARGELSTANHCADRCMSALRLLCRLRWQQSTARVSSFTSPFSSHFCNLPRHWHFVRQLQRLDARPRVISRTGFEDLRQMQQSGWKQFEPESSDSRAEVYLTPEHTWQGNYALRLKAMAPSDAERAVQTSVWVNSPAMSVQAGEILRIRTQVRINAAIEGLDGLMIFDSINGPAGARRLKKPSPWQEVVLYRWSDRPRDLIVTFALTGIGDVVIDDFIVETFGTSNDG